MKADPEIPLSALLGRGATWTGDLAFEGRVRIDGIYRGRIYTEDVLEIGEGGLVEGEIDAATLVVSGTASGGVRARRRVLLTSTGLIKGKLETPRVEVAPGGRIDAVVRIG